MPGGLIILLALAADHVVGGIRVDSEQDSQQESHTSNSTLAELASESETEGDCGIGKANSVARCRTFDKADKCTCSAFLDKPELQVRLEEKLYNAIQMVRKVSDKLTPDSGAFSKLWWGSSLGDAQKNLALLEEAFENMPALQVLADTPVQEIDPSVFVLPAGAWPIMVEIWDDNTATRQIHIGEVGVPFKDGDHQYTDVPLRVNTHTSPYVDPGSATVSFATSIKRTMLHECYSGGSTKPCMKFEVKVTCWNAKNLPNTDTGLFGDVTDPYCKVRVQTKTATASLKSTGKVINNNMNPEFNEEHRLKDFFQELIEPVPENELPDPNEVPVDKLVPYTIDYMTISEQLTTTVYNLATKVFINEEKCAPQNSRVPAFCRLIQSMGSFAVDKSALKELAESEKDAGAKKMADRLVKSSEGGSLSQVADMHITPAHMQSLLEVLSGRRTGGAAAVMAGMRAARRRRGGGGGRRYSGGGDDGGGGWLLLGMVLFIILMCCLA